MKLSHPQTTLADITSPINCIKPLGCMINLSFSKGIFPEFLKVPNVIPVHKKKTKMLLSLEALSVVSLESYRKPLTLSTMIYFFTN